MTIEEAVQLVVQAGAIGDDGHALVLDMGEPVRIADFARQLAASRTPEVPIVFTGLRPGEKLHEQLFCAAEDPQPSRHELIRQVSVPPLSPDVVRRLDPTLSPEAMLAVLRRLAEQVDAMLPCGDHRSHHGGIARPRAHRALSGLEDRPSANPLRASPAPHRSPVDRRPPAPLLRLVTLGSCSSTTSCTSSPTSTRRRPASGSSRCSRWSTDAGSHAPPTC